MNTSSHDFKTMRHAMVDSQLRTSDVTDRAVVAAMAAVPREDFVPAERVAIAYNDRSIRLANGRSLNPPLTIGRMLVEATIGASDNVLIVGAATGYSAALVATLAGHVTALESDAELLAHARKALDGMANVSVVKGDLAKGYKKGGPYSLILIDGAVESIPDTFAGQLAANGRVIAAIDDLGVTRVVRGVAAGDRIATVALADIEAAALPGFDRPKAFSFS